MKEANLLLWVKRPSKNTRSAPTPVDGGVTAAAGAAGAAVAFNGSLLSAFV